MGVFAVECRSASESQYHILLSNFDAAYRNLKAASETFNNALAEFSAGQYQYEGRSRIDYASRAHEDAREEFMLAVAELNEFLINQIISSRAMIREVASRG
jgi:hypothetical protein